MAVLGWFLGGFKVEFPRYQYQRLRWERAGKIPKDGNIQMLMQLEILQQAYANIFVMLIPAVLQAFDPRESFAVLEILGYILWIVAMCFETMADMQKDKFAAQMRARKEKTAVCNVGFWQYSRHPNYFGEWMVWNSLIISSLPSLWNLFLSLSNRHVIEQFVCIGGLSVGLISLSFLMYWCLVYYTGAKPAEHYSLEKRPEYAQYQKTTNMFFPWLPKKVATS